MDLYKFLLDFFPLIDEITYSNPVLGASLQAIALDALCLHIAKKDYELQLKQIKMLLLLCSDLGYVTEEVMRFLTREL